MTVLKGYTEDVGKVRKDASNLLVDTANVSKWQFVDEALVHKRNAEAIGGVKKDACFLSFDPSSVCWWKAMDEALIYVFLFQCFRVS
jgi:hypothetical protein